LFGAEGAHFGTITKDADKQQYILRAPGGRALLTITPNRDPHEMQMYSMYGGRVLERATVVRREPGRLPAQHFEVTVSPGVDSVLVLGCFLGLEAFAIPSGTEVSRTGGLFG